MPTSSCQSNSNMLLFVYIRQNISYLMAEHWIHSSTAYCTPRCFLTLLVCLSLLCKIQFRGYNQSLQDNWTDTLFSYARVLMASWLLVWFEKEASCNL